MELLSLLHEELSNRRVLVLGFIYSPRWSVLHNSRHCVEAKTVCKEKEEQAQQVEEKRQSQHSSRCMKLRLSISFTIRLDFIRGFGVLGFWGFGRIK